MDVGHHWSIGILLIHTPKEKRLTLPQWPSTDIRSSVRCGALWFLPPSILECWLVWSCVSLVQEITVDMSLWVKQPCHIQKTLLHRNLSQPLIFAVCLLFPSVPWPLWGGFEIIDVLFRNEHSSYFPLYFDDLWVFVLTSIYCKNKISLKRGKNCTDLWQ